MKKKVMTVVSSQFWVYYCEGIGLPSPLSLGIQAENDASTKFACIFIWLNGTILSEKSELIFFFFFFLPSVNRMKFIKWDDKCLDKNLQNRIPISTENRFIMVVFFFFYKLNRTLLPCFK